MSYLTAATEWLRAWGPISWGAAFFVGAGLSVLLYWCATVVSSIKIKNRYATKAIETSTVNPRDNKFEKQTIHLSQFFNPYYISHKNKTFSNCAIVGPAMLGLVGTVIAGGMMRHCQFVILKANTDVFGVIMLENCKIIDCEFCNVTFVMKKGDYDQGIPPDMKKYISIIHN